jgi:ATP-dependent DNA helicase RecQ
MPADTRQVLRALDGMTRAGLIRKGISMSAYVRFGIEDDSIARLRTVSAVETAMLQVMQEQEPDAEQHDWLHVSLRSLNQALLDRGVASSPELLRKLLDSLSRDGRGFAASRGSLEFRAAGRETYRLKLHRKLGAGHRDLAAAPRRGSGGAPRSWPGSPTARPLRTGCWSSSPART